MQTYKQIQGISIRLASSLEELTLEKYIQWQQEEEQIQLIDANLEELATLIEVEEVSEEDGEIREAEYNLDKYARISKQIELLTHPDDVKKLSKFTRIELYQLKLLAGMKYEEYTPGTAIKIPGANKAQIADLKDYLSKEVGKFDYKEKSRINKRIARLRDAEFIFLPVQEAIFATKARTDAVRNQLPRLPEMVVKDKELQKDEKLRKNLGAYIAKIESDLSAEGLDKTQEEAKELLQLSRKIREWQNQTETSVYELADQFLTHFLVPVDEPYSMTYAEARRPYIRKLSMSQVLPLINFILAVLRS